MPFPLTFQYIKGADNTVADALSRCPAAANTVTLVRTLWAGLINLIQTAAGQDEDYQSLLKEAREGRGELQETGMLLRTPEGQWLVPNCLPIRSFLISEAHDSLTSGHGGEEKTLQRLRERWKWKGDRADVADYVRTCVRCQRVKSGRRKLGGELFPILASEPGQIVTMDFVSKFAPAAGTGHQQCLVLVDKFSRFVFLEGCPLEISAQRTTELFCKRIVPLLGVPQKVISDRGPQFTAEL